MPLNVDTVYSASKTLVNKEQSGNFKPGLFNAIAVMANQDKFSEMVRVFQKTQTITDEMYPFLRKKPLIVPATGILPYPTDFCQFVVMKSKYKKDQSACASPVITEYLEGPIDILGNNQIGERLESGINAPTLKHGCGEQLNDGFHIYPLNMGTALLTYFKQPVNPKWGYTVGPNGLEVYNPATSTDFEWPWRSQNDLIRRICWYFGVNVREADIINTNQPPSP